MKRVVCGRTADGTSTILDDSGTGRSFDFGEGMVFTDVWATNTEVPLLAGEDITTSFSEFSVTDLPPGGTRFRVGVWPPTPEPLVWHATPTLDYLTVLSGALRLSMEDGSSTRLEPGDMVIQLGGVHQWHNDGDVPCVVSFVMVGAVGPTA